MPFITSYPYKIPKPLKFDTSTSSAILGDSFRGLAGFGNGIHVTCMDYTRVRLRRVPRISDVSPSIRQTKLYAHTRCLEQGWDRPRLFTTKRSIGGSRNLYRRSTTSDPGVGKTRPRFLTTPRLKPSLGDVTKIFSRFNLNLLVLLNSFVFSTLSGTNPSPSGKSFYFTCCFLFSFPICKKLPSRRMQSERRDYPLCKLLHQRLNKWIALLNF